MNRRNFMYFLKQKLCGLILLSIGVAVPVLLDGDVTVSLLVIPVGLYLTFTRERIMEF